ncbi:homoserine kinase [Alkalibacter mobilis]|uniref:homoserine kinase n=1 Tax=Alkalibacter mobilis TaxID=2787712 RepID=UPI00189DDC9C|nr:homoserine kinase [Alkalibacter mobilis]MBF7097052.1 homoserine kinase [Alkalibacter mobilis]
MTNPLTCRIKVPATSANLGPGFDVFGIALSLYNEFTITLTQKSSFKGCEKRFQNSSNLVYRSAQLLFQKYHADPHYNQDLSIVFKTEIPSGRGLGSSASCIVAGLTGANLLLGSPFDLNEIFQLACEVEGHPDNISPALFGGLTINTKNNDLYHYRKIDVSRKFDFYALIPDYEVSTEASRSKIPKNIPLEKVSLNIANSNILLLSLMNGDSDGVKLGSLDFIHEPRRKSFIKNYEILRNQALKSGALSFNISGSGPTILMICDRGSFQSNEYTDFLKSMDISWTLLKLTVDNAGFQYYLE